MLPNYCRSPPEAPVRIQMRCQSLQSLPTALLHNSCGHLPWSAHLRMQRVGAPSEFRSLIGRHCSSYSPGSTSSSTRPSSGMISCIHGRGGTLHVSACHGTVFTEPMCLQARARRRLQACSTAVSKGAQCAQIGVIMGFCGSLW